MWGLATIITIINLSVSLQSTSATEGLGFRRAKEENPLVKTEFHVTIASSGCIFLNITLHMTAESSLAGMQRVNVESQFWPGSVSMVTAQDSEI